MMNTDELARQKPFKDLNAAEQQAVLSDMSAADYDRLHHILQTASALDADVRAPDALKGRLSRAIPPPAGRRIPLWQAIGMAAVFSGGMYWLGSIREHPAPVRPEVLVRRDTFVRDSIRVVEKYRTRTVLRYHTDTIYLPPRLEAPAVAQPQAGKSLRDEPALERFFVKMER